MEFEKNNMFHSSRVFLGGFLLLFGTFDLWASSVVQFIVEGNGKTETAFIERKARACLGWQEAQNERNVDTSTLRQCLINTRLFASVDVSRETVDGPIVIKVEDRWSVIPLPYIRFDAAGRRQFGFLLADSNLMGQGRFAMIGGSISDTQSNTMAVYPDPSVAESNFGLSFVASRAVSDVYPLGRDRHERLDGFHEERTTFVPSLGFALSQRWNSSFVMRRSLRRFSSKEGFPANELTDNVATSLGFALKYDATDFKFYFQEGLSGYVSGSTEMMRSDDVRHLRSLMLTVSSQKAVFGHHALQVMGQLYRSIGGNKSDLVRIGGARPLRGIPAQGALTAAYSAIGLDYQIPLRDAPQGTWTVAPFGDFGSMTPYAYAASRQQYGSWGVGTYYFLKKIAVPGVGFEMGRCSLYEGIFASFSLGVTMS